MVTDLSQFDPMLEIKNRLFQVLPPYGDKYIKVGFPPNQPLALNSINLLLSKDQQDLPDGIYKMHFSVSPNDKVFQSVVHYRVANLINRVYAQMANYSVNPTQGIDACGNIEKDKNETVLIHIWGLLKGCQAVGKVAENIPDAENLYKQAMRAYDKLFGNNCKFC